MKITKRQLRRIIKEEKAKIINENYPIGGDETSPQWEAFRAAAYEVAAGFIDAGMEADGIMGAMHAEISSIIDEMEATWDDAAEGSTDSRSAVQQYTSRTDGLPKERR